MQTLAPVALTHSCMATSSPWRIRISRSYSFRFIFLEGPASAPSGAARMFFQRAIATTKVAPAEVTTDQARLYPAVLDALLPAAWHRTDRYANNRIECDHGRLKARLRPMRGLKQDRSARVVIAGHAFVQNVRRGHYELAVEEPTNRRLAVAFEELILAI